MSPCFCNNNRTGSHALVPVKISMRLLHFNISHRVFALGASLMHLSNDDVSSHYCSWWQQPRRAEQAARRLIWRISINISSSKSDFFPILQSRKSSSCASRCLSNAQLNFMTRKIYILPSSPSTKIRREIQKQEKKMSYQRNQSKMMKWHEICSIEFDDTRSSALRHRHQQS